MRLAKVGIIADVHVGNFKRFGGASTMRINRRCQMVLDVLARAIALVEEQHCTHLIIAGDLFDYDWPEAQVITATREILAQLNEFAEVYVLKGNHESSSAATGDHALGPLAPYAHIIDEPTLFGLDEVSELFAVPFRAGPVNTWLLEAIEGMVRLSEAGRAGAGPTTTPTPARLLALHMGIVDERTPPWLAGSQGAIPLSELRAICEQYRIGHVVAGDWHERREWKGTGQPGNRPHILQIGALVPTGWDNPGAGGYGTLAFWESRLEAAGGPRLAFSELPGPRFMPGKTSGDREAALAAAKTHAVFYSETVPPDEFVARAAANEAELGPLFAGVETLPDQAIAEGEARLAANAARSAETMHEALDAFVETVPLPEHVNRQAVLARCKGYLK